jgi:DNA-binding NarL/FixJ family response regulator
MHRFRRSPAIREQPSSHCARMHVPFAPGRCNGIGVDLMSTRIRVVLVEDHAILRAGLRALIELEEDLQVVAEASSSLEGLRVAQETHPALLITDLAMPGGSGLAAIEQLRATCPEVHVLVLTAYCTDEYIRAALKAGADGYVLKDASRVELLQAIRAVVAGQKYFSEPVSARVLSGYLGRGAPASEPYPRITEREREVLTRIALGDSNKRVALALRLSIKTVEKHRANLMRKLELHNTAAVTLFAVRNGLVPAAATEQSGIEQRAALP